MKFFYRNGEFHPEEIYSHNLDQQKVSSIGFFETIQYFNQKLLFLEEHLCRINSALKEAKIAIPKELDFNSTQEIIHQLIEKNKLGNNARIRLSIIQNRDKLDLKIKAIPLTVFDEVEKTKGKSLAIFDQEKKHFNSFSRFKQENFDLYQLAGKYAREKNFDDAVFLNQSNHICETSIANIYIIKGNEIFTPQICDGCVAGIFRNWLLKNCHLTSFKILESTFSLQQLLSAEEVFTTNAIQQIFPVSSIENYTYKTEKTMKLIAELKKLFPEIIH